MKFRLISIVLVVLIVLACGFTAFGEEDSAADNTVPTSTVSADSALTARLENMLDHNRVYNNDFSDINTIIDNSVVALFDKADEDGFVANDVVNGFVFSMYGITTAEYEPNSAFPKKEDHIFIIPRGYDVYDHAIISAEIDGDYIHVNSVFTVNTHEGFTYEYDCKTIFKVNSLSGFGYNIVSSNYY